MTTETTVLEENEKNVRMDERRSPLSTGDPLAMSGKPTDTARKKLDVGPGSGMLGLSPSTFQQNNPASDTRAMRRIIAEDPDWSLATVPLLVDLVIKHIVINFAHNAKILNDLMPKHKVMVLNEISVKLSLKVTAELVEDEGYWKRCCQMRWHICDVSSYGDNWKRMYFERNLQKVIENFVPEMSNLLDLEDLVQLSANYVRRVEIKQLLPPVKEPAAKLSEEADMSDGEASDSGDGPEIDHFNFFSVLSKLPNLREFSVVYGIRDCGMNFEWNLFQFTARDCLLLAKCVASTRHLQKFSLQHSRVDDDKVRVLISHLLDHPGLLELNLAHNIISDRGARAIGKFLNNHSQLVKLDLSDNNIRPAGAQAIAHALTKNSTLTNLSLRMNRLGDEGGQAICRALLKNCTLVHLNLGSNDLTEPTAAILAQVVLKNSTVHELDLSCNRLGPDGGKQLQEGMEENGSITRMDLRLTDCGQESEYCINQILQQNREREREAMQAAENKQKK